MTKRSANNTYGAHLPIVDYMPSGWLSIKDFAERGNITTSRLNVALREGAFSDAHVAKYQPPGKPAMLIIDWNRGAYDWINSKHPTYWPEDFEPNEAREYRPLPVDNEELSVVNRPESQKNARQEIVDIHSAKFEHEKLKVLALENQIRKADNEVIELKELEADNRKIALEVKAALMAYIRKVTPLVAATSNPRKIDRILNHNLADALRSLQDLEGVDDDG